MFKLAAEVQIKYELVGLTTFLIVLTKSSADSI